MRFFRGVFCLHQSSDLWTICGRWVWTICGRWVCCLSQVDLDDLRKVGLLGCGGFGAVTLEQSQRSGKTYALKALSKGYVVRMKMQRGVLREKEVGNCWEVSS